MLTKVKGEAVYYPIYTWIRPCCLSALEYNWLPLKF